jgi:HEAT repeat protein
MPIRFRCKCGKIVKVEDEHAGRRATCPNCGGQLVVPSVSTIPEAAGPNAKAEPSPQLPEPPAPELQLESESLGPGGKTGDTVGNVLELEFERLGPGGKTGDTVEEVTDVEEVAPESEISEVVPLPDDSAPAEAPSEPTPERTCPNCGVAVAPNAIKCAECGASLMPEKAVAKKISGIVNAFNSLREHKKFPLIAAVSAVGVILLLTVVVLAVRKLRKPKPVPVARQFQRGPQPAQPQKVAEKPKPPPVQFHWPGFSDPATIARDRILKLGQELAAYVNQNHRPPATLAEAGVTEADEYGYVGAEIAALPRFHAIAYEVKPSASHDPYVLFSDGSARPVPAAQIPSVLLKKTESGWMTDTDAALLAKTAPVIRVTNERFTSLEVALNDKPAGVAPQGGKCEISAVAGPKQKITFTAGDQKDDIEVDLEPGIVYTFVHPRQADLPWLPMRQYRAAMTGQPAPGTEKSATPAGRPAPPVSEPSSSFTVERDERDGFVVKALKSSTENVEFLDRDGNTEKADGRTALAPDLLSIHAKITRGNENLTIEGPAPDKPILVNKIGSLEAGVVRFKGDITVTFRQTALGALRCEALPNAGPGTVSLPEAEPGKPPASKPATTPPPRLAFPAATFTLLPDCQALAGAIEALKVTDAVRLLLQRAQLETKPAEAAPATVRNTPPANVEGPPNMPPQGRRGMPPQGRRGMPPGGFARFQRPQQGREGATGKAAEAVERERSVRPPEEISAPLVYGALAFYGDSSAFDALKDLKEQYDKEKMPVESVKPPAYAPFLLALGRSGRMSALTYLRAASDNAPTSAVIALCTIDAPTVPDVLKGIFANWTPEKVTEAVDEWPVVAGPTCRRTFVETLASAKPDLLDDPAVLNALMKLDPFALERALAARLAPAPVEPTPQPPPTTRSPSTPQPPSTSQPPPPAQKSQPSARGPGREMIQLFIAQAKAKAKAKAARMGPAPKQNPSPKPMEATGSGPAGPPFWWIVLAHFKNDAAVTRFVQLLGSENDPATRLNAAAALGEVGDPSVVPILTALLKDQEVAMRQTAATSLARMPDADVVAALDAAMDKDLLVPAIVEQATAMAAKAGREATAKLLAKMLAVAFGQTPTAVTPPPNEGPTPSRGGGFMPPRGRGASQPPAKVPTPTPASTAGDPGMATRIFDALSRLGLYSPEVRAAFEAACGAREAGVRVAAYKAREQAIAAESAADRSASAIAAAGLALKDTDATVRCAGIALLKLADPQEARSLLLPALKDPADAVRAAAVSALPEIAGDQDIAAAINEALKNDPSPDVVRAAALAAAQRHDPAFGDAVLAAFKQASGKPGYPSAVLASLAEVAAELQLQGAAGPLELLLSADHNRDVRIAAIRALGALKDATVPSSIQSVLNDKDTSVVEEAVRALSGLDAPDAVTATLDALVGKSALPDELRRRILTSLAAHFADPNSAYKSWWEKSGSALQDSDLEVLVSIASSATDAERAGSIALAEGCLADSTLETTKRAAAASILAKYAEDADVRNFLLDKFEKDATGIAQAAAEALRNVRDDSMIDGKLWPYYEELSKPSGGPSRPGMMAAGRGGPPPGARRGMPGGLAPATPPSRLPGLAKATEDENRQLREAIIEALGSIGGDHAGKALTRIAELDQTRNSDEMAPYLIKAFAACKASTSIRDLYEYYVKPSGPHSRDAISALARLASLDSARVTNMLRGIATNERTPHDVAAAAMDALDQIPSAGGA